MEQFSTPQKMPMRPVLKEINSNDFITNKTQASVQPPLKSSVTLDSDISGIESTIDNTLSSGLDSTLDTSYQTENPNATLGDLLSGFDGMKLDTSQRQPNPNPKNHDANNSMSSDEEMFQECESGFDLDTTATNTGPSPVQAHSSNIDGHNIFDKTINFSTIVANSTAGLVASASTTANFSQLNEKSDDMLFKTSEAGQTLFANQTFEPSLNQTSEMPECHRIDEVVPPKNVSVNVAIENAERNSPSLENTFSDLHVKYEKSKQMAAEVKDSEAKLVEKLEFCQTQMKLQEQRYDKLKNHALSQLEGANAKLEALNRAHTNETKKLAAQLKKEEFSRQSIMEQLTQKTKENAELVKICDELINNGADGS